MTPIRRSRSPAFGSSDPDSPNAHVNGGESERLVGDGDDHSPLLGGARKLHEDDPQLEGTASLASGIGNLLNTIVGTGMLSFPLAMASAGLIPGIITCVFSGVVAAFGLHLLTICATRTPHRRASFFAISQLTFPRAAVFFDAAIAVKCFGVSISYLIIIKGLAPSVVKALFHVLSPDTVLPAWSLSGRFWISVFMTILIPLCFLRKLDSLRHTSYIALFSVAYLVVVVVVSYISPPKGSLPPGEIHLIKFSGSFISTFPVQVFAFTCAQNLFPIYNEMYKNTQKRMDTVVGSSIGTAAVIYEIVAVLGYLSFGSRVGANIIAMYPATTLFIAFGQLAIVILVLFSYPLQVHPCRNCLDKVFGAPHKKVVAVPQADQALPEDDADLDMDPDHNSVEMSELKHIILTMAIVTTGYITALIVSDLQLVLSFVGSTGSTTISFILPGLFYFKMFRNDSSRPRKMVWLALSLAIYGICILVFCLSYNIYRVATG